MPELLDSFREALAAERKPQECRDILKQLLFAPPATMVAILGLLLDSSDAQWRWEAFAYVSSVAAELTPKIRDVVRSDEQKQVREEAARVPLTQLWNDLPLLHGAHPLVNPAS